MSEKRKAFWIWTIFLVVLYVLVGFLVSRDKAISGTNLEFNTIRNIDIDADKVTIEAAGSSFFVLRKETGESITAIPAPRPLGWESINYFVAGPEEIPGGEWILVTGSPSIKITSDTVVMVTLLTNAPAVWFMLFLLSMVIWMFGILIGSY